MLPSAIPLTSAWGRIRKKVETISLGSIRAALPCHPGPIIVDRNDAGPGERALGPVPCYRFPRTPGLLPFSLVGLHQLAALVGRREHVPALERVMPRRAVRLGRRGRHALEAVNV